MLTVFQCGQGPFARVTKAWIPEDQSLPPAAASRLVRRDGSVPTVRALSLDTQFDKASATYVSSIIERFALYWQ